MRHQWLLCVPKAFVLLCMITCADSELPVYTTNLHIERTSLLSTSSVLNGGEETCGCEDDFPPGAGFAFRREGYAIVNLEGGKVAGRLFLSLPCVAPR